MHRIVARVLVLWLVASPSLAQLGGFDPRELGWDRGIEDGRRAGYQAGFEMGRPQAELEAWLDGFSIGVRAPADRSLLDAAREDGRRDGERPGALSGRELGRQEGTRAALDAYGRLEGAPPRPLAPLPPPVSVPPSSEGPACARPQPVRLLLGDGQAVTIDPSDAEVARPALRLDMPQPPTPDRDDARILGERDGLTGDDLDVWIRGYREGWTHSWIEEYREARERVPRGTVSRWTSEGERVGEREADRRAACAEYRQAHAEGFEDAHARAHADAWMEAWDKADEQHRTRPVVRVASATLVDGSGDGVVEPGEAVVLDLALVNAALVDAAGDVASWSGALSLASSGRVEGGLRAQTRRQERIDAGRVEATAPLGASLVVEVRPTGGDPASASTRVGRPVVVEDVAAILDVRDGALVATLRPRVRNVSTGRADRGLVLVAGGTSHALGPSDAGSTLAPDLAVAVPIGALKDGASGEVELREGALAWMRVPWEARPDMTATVRLSSLLLRAGGSADAHAALSAVASRLDAELTRAVAEPKLYERADGQSELEMYAAAVGTLPAAERAPFEQRVSAPLLVRAEAKGIPRKARRAVRQALGAD